jgi:hypothetical protein
LLRSDECLEFALCNIECEDAGGTDEEIDACEFDCFLSYIYITADVNKAEEKEGYKCVSDACGRQGEQDLGSFSASMVHTLMLKNVALLSAQAVASTLCLVKMIHVATQPSSVAGHLMGLHRGS